MVQTLPRCIAVVGPTGVGKSALALNLAERLGGEIINLDSVQVYRELNIGAAKPSDEEFARVPHHLFNIVSVAEPFDVARYRALAYARISELIARGKIPILCGGTTMYLTVLLHGLFEATRNSANVEKSEENAKPPRLSPEERAELYAELQAQDPVRAAQIHLNDTQRIRRAVDLLRAGIKPSELAQEHRFQSAHLDALMLVCSAERSELYRRINERAAAFVERGIIEETDAVAAQHPGVRALDSLGYRQVLQWNRRDRGELVDSIATATRQFAKRQLTFWRNEPRKRGWSLYSQSIAANAGDTETAPGGSIDSIAAERIVSAWIDEHRPGRFMQQVSP